IDGAVDLRRDELLLRSPTKTDRLRDALHARTRQPELHLRPRRLEVVSEHVRFASHAVAGYVRPVFPAACAHAQPRRGHVSPCEASRPPMAPSDDNAFARLVSLAAHDLRTPLATVHGFVRTIERTQELGDPLARY